jgi:hypothetical protein
MNSLTSKSKFEVFCCERCEFTCSSARALRYHKRYECSLQNELVVAPGNKVLQDVPLVPSSSSVLVSPDSKSPIGNIDPEQHHSVDAKFDCRYTHREAKKPPECLPERRPRLKLPSSAEEWKKIDEELREALPQVFPKAEMRRMSCSEAEARFEAYLYDFIAQRIPQESEKKKHNLSKTAAITRIKAAIEKNKKQKKHHKKHVKSLKSCGLFNDIVAKSCAKLWRKLLKVGNKFRLRLKHAKEFVKQRRANAKFRANPYAFAKTLFKPKSENADAVLDKERCENYFPNLYKDEDRTYTYKPMAGMKRPPEPSYKLNLEVPKKSEFKRAVWSKRNAASPGRNGVNYLVYKKLTAAFDWLYYIIRKAWDGDIPDSWAQAAVVLLYKDEDAADPKNYRPIALQSCSGKIYFSIWAKRLEVFMTKNGYFKRAKQKGFLSGIAGCNEHIATLKAALENAKAHKRQIVVAWIDLKNAFGSVSHNLIQFALEWYHIPFHLSMIIFKYYEMLFATIETKDWSSRCFTYEIGVFQGCVISPLLFNMVFNLLLDLLSPKSDQNGYDMKEAQVRVHDLAYADDLSIVAKSPKCAQDSIDMVDVFLRWTRTMAAKPRKCKSLALKLWTAYDPKKGRRRLINHAFAPFDAEIKIAGKMMGFIGFDSFKFLGWKVYHDISEKNQRADIRETFEKHMKVVDDCAVHGFMKMWLYQHYVVAFLAWPFIVYDLCVSWVLDLQKIATKYLKRWSGIYASAVTSILYRPRENFGLQLCSLVSFYQRLQIGQAFALKYSADLDLGRIYATKLARQDASLSHTWRPFPTLEKLEKEVDHKLRFNGQTDRAGLGFKPGYYTRDVSLFERKKRILAAFSRSVFQSYTVSDIHKAMQGCFLRFHDTEPFDLSWNHLIGTRNPRLITWVLNASINSVVTPDLRKLWGLRSESICQLCGHKQASLFHILSGCRVALTQMRYTWRHDSVLITLQDDLQRRVDEHNASPCKVVTRSIKFRSRKDPIPKRSTKSCSVRNSDFSILGVGSDWVLQIDYTDNQVPFPVHICVTNRRPDIVLHSASMKTVIIIELTCPAEENISDARLRKELKYAPLKKQIIDNGWKCHLKTIEVGVRGLVSGSVPRCLRHLGFSNTRVRELTRMVSRAAARCSFAIYKSCRVKKWKWMPLVRIGRSNHSGVSSAKAKHVKAPGSVAKKKPLNDNNMLALDINHGCFPHKHSEISDKSWLPSPTGAQERVSSPHKHSETSDKPWLPPPSDPNWIQQSPAKVVVHLPSSSVPKTEGIVLLPSSSSPRF